MNIRLLIICFLFFLLAASCGEGKKEGITNEKASPSKETVTTSKEATKTIIFFGNSLTAGYGVEPSQAFPALIQKKLIR